MAFVSSQSCLRQNIAIFLCFSKYFYLFSLFKINFWNGILNNFEKHIPNLQMYKCILI